MIDILEVLNDAEILWNARRATLGKMNKTIMYNFLFLKFPFVGVYSKSK